ncbi:glycosyl transferase [Papiliotrema laurentii]|uniref:Class E vacuolar protein-sorting machinery protein HSE1 n=1 Tax=Papiliotrema laurentii TaxID=5418 RepID=A0AAD9CXU0_PAPLA|nr:glycosyl transferase [Papiliotrema laurentii]
MFAAAPNPYDELIVKATDENLASEDWALNLEVCDKVSGEGQAGARNAVGALQKRLAHRNPSVQLYALELANTLAQNCGKPLLEELSSRNWTGALDRLVNDRTTAGPVKKKALGYIKAWAKQFEETGDANLGIMGELYDQLRSKNFTFDDPEPVPESVIDERQRREEEELQRVLELSKQDKGGRSTYQPSSSPANGSSSSRAAAHTQSQPSYTNSAPAQQPAYAPPHSEPEPAPVDINTATRVRALYTFTTSEVGELNFERGDVIKVLDRGFKEWWRGACNGKIGIFPVTYVEAMPEPTPAELQEEAQEEARVFASLGLVDQLLQNLRAIDPSRGDRLDDRPEVEEMYQASVSLQGQINALIKKYSDQKAELEHMNANFLRAMKQYEELRNGSLPPPQQQPFPPQAYAQQSAYGQQSQPQLQHQSSYDQQPYAQQNHPEAAPAEQYHPQPAAQTTSLPQPQPYQPTAPHPFPQASHSHSQEAVPGQFYQHNPTSQSSLQRAPTGAPDLPPSGPHRNPTLPGAAGLGAGRDSEAEHRAAWDAYYAQQAQNQGQAQDGLPPQPYGASPYPSQAEQGQQGGQQPPWGQRSTSGGSVEQLAGGVNRMTVHGQ